MRNYFYGSVLILSLVVVLACSVPTTPSDSPSEGGRGPHTALMATDVTPEGIQFPIWWVEEDYMSSGGSPLVVVFSSDKKIYTRTAQNSPLKATGTWEYDSKEKRIELSGDSGASFLIKGTNEWDGVVLNGVKLNAGEADFNDFNVFNWWVFSDLQYLKDDGTFSKLGYFSLYLDLNRGNMNMGGGFTFIRARWAGESPRGDTTDRWQLSPLGDKVSFPGLPAGSIEFSFDGKKRIINLNYRNRVHIANELDNGTGGFYTNAVKGRGVQVYK